MGELTRKTPSMSFGYSLIPSKGHKKDSFYLALFIFGCSGGRQSPGVKTHKQSWEAHLEGTEANSQHNGCQGCEMPPRSHFATSLPALPCQPKPSDKRSPGGQVDGNFFSDPHAPKVLAHRLEARSTCGFKPLNLRATICPAAINCRWGLY